MNHLIKFYSYNEPIASYVDHIFIALCEGDSGAPLWLKEGKIVVAVHQGTGKPSGRYDFPCGYGEDVATRTTYPEVLKFLKLFQ